MELPWTEKYRPQKIEEIVGQDAVVDRLKAYVKEKTLPNLIFAGPAGVGKTTAALALAREFFGDINHDFMELNASDERGIDVVRTKIKDFARTRPINGTFKLIFLDEADALTPEAQNAMRRTMENYTKTCRFILSCNYSSKIIEPIQSRCAVFRFKRIQKNAVEKRIKKILEKEKKPFDQNGIDAILYVSEGDLRRAINICQSSAALGKVDEENVYSISSRARPEEVLTVLELSLKGKFLDARNLLDKLMINQGLSAEDILIQMNREVMNLKEDDLTKVKIIDFVGEANFRLVEGANERIQMEALLARILNLGLKQ
ncbi:MAG: replication factor C small subunit [Candidatus Altiarchaeota archaeon]